MASVSTGFEGRPTKTARGADNSPEAPNCGSLCATNLERILQLQTTTPSTRSISPCLDSLYRIYLPLALPLQMLLKRTARERVAQSVPVVSFQRQLLLSLNGIEEHSNVGVHHLLQQDQNLRKLLRPSRGRINDGHDIVSRLFWKLDETGLTK